MTPQEAIQNLNQECAIAQHRCGCKINRTDCDSCYIWTAIKALEKQIPKKAEYHTPDFDVRMFSWWTCGNCGCEIVSVCDKYCSYCGQRIDWGVMRNE